MQFKSLCRQYVLYMKNTYVFPWWQLICFVLSTFDVSVKFVTLDCLFWSQYIVYCHQGLFLSQFVIASSLVMANIDTNHSSCHVSWQLWLQSGVDNIFMRGLACYCHRFWQQVSRSWVVVTIGCSYHDPVYNSPMESHCFESKNPWDDKCFKELENTFSQFSF